MKYPKPYADSTLKRKYRELPLSAETVALLHKYLDAMNNLYMIIPLKKAYEIIMSQNPDLDMSEETFGAFTALVRREDHPYYILEEDDLLGEETEESDHDRFLAHECLFLYSDDDFYVLAEQQTGKPYYIPDREIFLSYADDFYYEPNPSYDKFKTFLRKELKETDEQRIEDILFEVIIAIENDNEQNPIQLIQSVLDDMERIKVFFFQREAGRDVYQSFYGTEQSHASPFQSRLYTGTASTDHARAEACTEIDDFRSGDRKVPEKQRN